MKNNTNKQSENVSLISVPAIIKKIEDSPHWKTGERKRKKRSAYSSRKKWIMPEQEAGYIKAKQYDFL